MANKKPGTAAEVQTVIVSIRQRNYENMKAMTAVMSKEERAIFHEGREIGLVQAGYYMGLMTAAGMTPDAPSATVGNPNHPQ